MTKKRYVQVGLGGRSGMFSMGLAGHYSQWGALTAVCDLNPGRLARRVKELADRGVQAQGYAAADFDRMIAEQKPDTVIVTTKDSEHDRYICRAMELGCDAITEKPMTTDEAKCQRILDTVRHTRRKCTVTFNYRYSPARTMVKELLMSGVIGEVLSLDFHWLLDVVHGADYFRRWHRYFGNSGSLWVHKSTHHFDLVNWWLSAIPETVFATGRRAFYTPQTADRYGLTQRGERCHGCPEAKRCNFFLDLAGNQDLRGMYLDHEQHDGYFRDRCVFAPDIEIWDTMHAICTYDTGAQMSYSLHTYMPWEGYLVSFNGTKGRLEHVCQETVYVSGDGSVPGEILPEGTAIRVFPHWRPAYEVEIPKGKGGHGGGDGPLLNAILDPTTPPDPLMRSADHRAGAYSILTGVAARRSIERGQPVRISDLVQGLERPDFPAMPTPFEPLSLEKGHGCAMGGGKAREIRLERDRKQLLAGQQPSGEHGGG